MQGLVTKFVGPTNHRGARVIADAGDGRRKTTPWDYAASVEENHKVRS